MEGDAVAQNSRITDPESKFRFAAWLQCEAHLLMLFRSAAACATVISPTWQASEMASRAISGLWLAARMSGIERSTAVTGIPSWNWISFWATSALWRAIHRGRSRRSRAKELRTEQASTAYHQGGRFLFAVGSPAGGKTHPEAVWRGLQSAAMGTKAGRARGQKRKETDDHRRGKQAGVLAESSLDQLREVWSAPQPSCSRTTRAPEPKP